MAMLTITSRVQGALFGLAICDALGAPVEFKPRGSFSPVTEIEPNFNFSLPAGCFTDDTSMALCLAQSLIDQKGEFEVQDQVRKYIAWSREGYMSSVPERGCFDIGVGTRLVLMAWRKHFRENGYGKPGSVLVRSVTEEGLKVIREAYGDEHYCGNGSLMRVIPIALAFHCAGLERACHLAQESSRVTHPHPRCQEACSIYTRLACKALQGAEKKALAEALADLDVQDDQLRSRLSRYKDADSWKQQEEGNIRSTGYVLDTLEAALWAFFSTNTFEDGAIRVVNLGDDADTVGAVYGGLAGAHYGLDALPPRWIQAMRNRDLLQSVAEGLEGLQGGAES
jgi:ADP-ribosyl-[dinitrogen reductase] hydrolase